jgi:fumarate reductase subunit C
MLILVMGSIHMWVVLTDLPITAAKSAARVQTGFWAVFYLFLLPLAELHVGIGFYRIGVKWGFIKDRERGKFKRGENILTLTFICIGLVTLARFLFFSLN